MKFTKLLLRLSLLCLLFLCVFSLNANAITIDKFLESQSLTTHPDNKSDSSVIVTSDAIGGTRSLESNHLVGVGNLKTRINPFQLNEGVFQHDTSSGVAGSSVVYWDGDTIPGLSNPRGLRGIDLTEDGATAFTFNYDCDASTLVSNSFSFIIKVYDASDPNGGTWSEYEASIDKCTNTFMRTKTVPFSAITSTGPNGAADIRNVGAISLVVHSPDPASDLQFKNFKTNGNCEHVPNNGVILDACGVCDGNSTGDTDNDGVCNELDNCLDIKNRPQTDSDNDGIGDACDPCPIDPTNDADSDGVCQDIDNCPDEPNPTQTDSDNDGIGDACDIDPEKLRSPVYTKFNTYLLQWNFLELSVAGTESLDVKVTLVDISGRPFAVKNITVQANSQLDVDVNRILIDYCNVSDCSNIIDPNGEGDHNTYGLVKLEFDDRNPNAQLMGRLSNYRQNQDKRTFSYGFARELRNPLQGITYTTTNTNDPQGRGYQVPNWVEVIYLGNGSNQNQEGFTVHLYDRTGKLIRTAKRRLFPLTEFDITGGHAILDETGNAVEEAYLAEVIPDNPNAEYFLSGARYSSNSPINVLPETYNFAFAVDGRKGSDKKVLASISSEAFECGNIQSYIEVANITNQDIEIKVKYRDRFGNTIKIKQPGGSEKNAIRQIFKPKSQFHFNATAMLEKNEIGTVQISSTTPNSFIAQTLNYVFDCDANQVLSAYVSVAKGESKQIQLGSINTFLGIENVLRLINISKNGNSNSLLDINTINGQTFDFLQSVFQLGIKDLNLNTEPQILLPTKQYGTIRIESGADNETIGEVLRIRKAIINGKSKIDFIMPTAVK